MGATNIGHDITKSIVRWAGTAGLSKDVIDLLEKKLQLLADQLAIVSKKLLVAEDDKRKLQSENEALIKKLGDLQPVEALGEQTIAILQFFFDEATDLTAEDVGSRFQLHKSLSDYHFDLLLKRNFIRQTFAIAASCSGAYAITDKGRSFIVNSIRQSHSTGI